MFNTVSSPDVARRPSSRPHRLHEPRRDPRREGPARNADELPVELEERQQQVVVAERAVVRRLSLPNSESTSGRYGPNFSSNAEMLRRPRPLGLPAAPPNMSARVVGRRRPRFQQLLVVLRPHRRRASKQTRQHRKNPSDHFASSEAPASPDEPRRRHSAPAGAAPPPPGRTPVPAPAAAAPPRADRAGASALRLPPAFS